MSAAQASAQTRGPVLDLAEESSQNSDHSGAEPGAPDADAGTAVAESDRGDGVAADGGGPGAGRDGDDEAHASGDDEDAAAGLDDGSEDEAGDEEAEEGEEADEEDDDEELVDDEEEEDGQDDGGDGDEDDDELVDEEEEEDAGAQEDEAEAEEDEAAPDGKGDAGVIEPASSAAAAAAAAAALAAGAMSPSAPGMCDTINAGLCWGQSYDVSRRVAHFFLRDFEWGNQVLRAYWVRWTNTLREGEEGLGRAAEHLAALSRVTSAAAEAIAALHAEGVDWSSAGRWRRAAPEAGPGGAAAGGAAAGSKAPYRAEQRGLGPSATPGSRLGAALGRWHASAAASLNAASASLTEEGLGEVLAPAKARFHAAATEVVLAGSPAVDSCLRASAAVSAAWRGVERLRALARGEGAADGRGGAARRPPAPPHAADPGEADLWLAEARFLAACRVSLAARRRCLRTLGQLFDRTTAADRARAAAIGTAAELMTSALGSLGGSGGKAKGGGPDDVIAAVRGMSHGADSLRTRLELAARPLLASMLVAEAAEEGGADPRAECLGFAADGTDVLLDGLGDGASLAGAVSVLSFVGMAPSDVPSPLASPHVLRRGPVRVRTGGVFRQWSGGYAVVTVSGWLHVYVGDTLSLGCSPEAAGLATPAAERGRAGATGPGPAAGAAAAPASTPTRAIGVPAVFPGGKAFSGVSDVQDASLDDALAEPASLLRPWRSVDLVSCPPGSAEAEREDAMAAAASTALRRRKPHGESSVEVRRPSAQEPADLEVAVTTAGLFGSSTKRLALRVEGDEAEAWVRDCWRAAHAARMME